MRANTTRRPGTIWSMALVGLLMCLPLLALLAAGYWLNFQFDRRCGNYLKMAGDAGSIATARARLDAALGYLEGRRLTEGHTWIFWADPTCEIAPWYANLKAEQAHLRDFPATATESDRNNTLMKLREVLLDHSNRGDVVTVPDNIAEYPNNAAFFWGYVLTGPLGGLGLLVLSFGLADNPKYQDRRRKQ